MTDLPTLTDEERLALQHRLRSLAAEIDDAIEEAAGDSLPFILLTWDGNGTFHVSNVSRDFARLVMEMQLERWDQQQDAPPSKARQH